MGNWERVTFLLAVSLLVFSCGRDGEDQEAVPPAESAVTGDPVPERTAEPFSIDPDREEAIRTGTQAERLLAKYDLLIERIRLERAEASYNIARTVELGLKPLAREQNRFFEEGVFDSTLTLEFIHLSEFVLVDHIYQENDPRGEKAAKRIAHVREMIDEHQTAR